MKDWKDWRVYACRLVPFGALIFIVIAMRGESPPEVLYAPFFLGLLVLSFISKRAERLPMIVVGTVLLGLWLSYILHTADFRYFLRSVTIYLGVLAIARFFAFQRWGAGRSVKTALVIALVIDLLLGLEGVRKNFDGPIRRDVVKQDDQIDDFFPMGIYSRLIGIQAIRYPEMLRHDFNFLGARFLECQKLQYKNPADCELHEKNADMAFWVTFYISKEFVRLFMSDELWNAATGRVKSSFLQGAARDSLFNFRPSPYCGVNGYAVIEHVSGQEMRFVTAGPRGTKFVLPFFPADLNVRTVFGSTVGQGTDRLIELDLKDTFEVLTLRPSARWSAAVVLFWFPFVIFVGFAASAAIWRRLNPRLNN